jgi:dTDP-4-dehydrorhamnose reductase
MKILIMGATGMLGSAVLRVLDKKPEWQVYGTVRDPSTKRLFGEKMWANIITGINIEQADQLVGLLHSTRPDIVINCIGLIKQKEAVDDPLVALPINSIFPHRLAGLCKLIDARLIHISTDCVFSGSCGNYLESDMVDARDLYGISKAIGEVTYSHTVTLRTSIIGHELQSANGLLEWFLSQKDVCKGYASAIFSGLPTVVLAGIIRDYVIPNRELSGLYHVASEPISKFDLLKIISHVYGKEIKIIRDDKIVINRSLNSKRFEHATNFVCPGWLDLVKTMQKSLS